MHRPAPAIELALRALPPASCAPRPQVQFALASPADDAALRSLLRENPMAGQISLTLEREPSYFAAGAIEGGDRQTILAKDEGRIICAGSVSERSRYINGQSMRIGYLGGLRLNASARGQASIIRRGYELFRHLHDTTGGPPIYLTSITEDNLPARRFLERGLPGMPNYRPLGRLVTLVIRRRRNANFFKPTGLVRRGFRTQSLDVIYGSAAIVPELIDLLNRDLSQYQFAPCWRAAELLDHSLGLSPEEFRLACTRDGTPVACAALWDQRAFKQTVVRGYATTLRRLRPFYNAAAAVLGRPRLPRIGEALSNAYISHVAADSPQHIEWLIRLLHSSAYSRKIDYLTLAFDERDPRLPHLRKAFKPREYVTRLYAVHWPDGASLASSLQTDRLLAPEIAIL